MSDMQPRGIPVTIGGKDWQLLLTIAAADIIQDHYDAPLETAMNRLFPERERYGTCAYMLSVLISEQARRDGIKKFPDEAALRDLIDVPEANRLTPAILQAYGLHMPKPDDDEDEDPNVKRSRRS